MKYAAEFVVTSHWSYGATAKLVLWLNLAFPSIPPILLSCSTPCLWTYGPLRSSIRRKIQGLWANWSRVGNELSCQRSLLRAPIRSMLPFVRRWKCAGKTIGQSAQVPRRLPIFFCRRKGKLMHFTHRINRRRHHWNLSSGLSYRDDYLSTNKLYVSPQTMQIWVLWRSFSQQDYQRIASAWTTWRPPQS